MGIQDNGALGGFRGKSGANIGRRVMGQNIVGPLPHPSTKPRTALQVFQQDKFGMLNSVLERIVPLLRAGFKKSTKRNTTSNAAYSYNYDRVYSTVEGDLTFDFSKLAYSKGSVATPNCPTVTLVESAGEIAGDVEAMVGVAFSWLPERESEFNRVTDLASFLVYNPDKREGVIKQNVVSRGALGYVIDVPAELLQGRVHCYMSFASKDGKMVGDSVYVGEL